MEFSEVNRSFLSAGCRACGAEVRSGLNLRFVEAVRWNQYGATLTSLARNGLRHDRWRAVAAERECEGQGRHNGAGAGTVAAAD